MSRNQDLNKPIIYVKDKIFKDSIDENNLSSNANQEKQPKANPWCEYLKWSEYIKQNKEDFDLFDPTRIQDLDLKRNKHKQVIFMEPSRSQKKLKILQQSGQVFHDEQFLPNDQSLYGPYPHNPNWQVIKWQKLLDHFPQGIIFKNRNVAPRDIRQGFLGDCYFLAGLAALAQSPNRIIELFLIEQKNKQKYFSVKILYQGKWTKIDLDQMVPFAYGKPAFSGSVDGGLWVILLQKAWAKIYKSYKQIQAGFAEEVLHDLTGAPVTHIIFKGKKFKKDESWEILDKGSDKNYAMVCCSNPGNDTDKSPSGIVQGHAYTFLNATSIKIGNATQRIVKLRNPWGAVQFNGRWSDLDKIWDKVSQSEKKRVVFQPQEDDGTFFMSYDDFLKQFMYIEIAQINDNASYIYESYRDTEMKGVYFTIRVLHQGDYSLQIDLTPQRSFDEQIQMRYRYPKGHLTLKKLIDQKKSQLICEISDKKKRTICHKEHLSPGKYVAFVKIDWDTQFEKSFIVNLACYSKYACGIYISSVQDAAQFTGNPKTMWLGQFYKYIFKARLGQRIDALLHDQKQQSQIQNDNDGNQSPKKGPFFELFDALLKKQEEKQQNSKKQQKNQQQQKKKKQQIEQQIRKQLQKDKLRQRQKQRQKQKQKQRQKQRQRQRQKQKEKDKEKQIKRKQKKEQENNKMIKRQKNGKKVLKTIQKITHTETTKTHKKDSSNNKITIQTKQSDISNKTTFQYTNRKHLQTKIIQKHTIQSNNTVFQNNQQVKQKTSIWQQNVKQKTDKQGRNKIKKQEKEHTEQIMYETDNQSDDQTNKQLQFDNSDLLKKLQFIKSDYDLSDNTKEMEQQQKKSLIIQAQNTDITTPTKSKQVPIFNNQQAQSVRKLLLSHDINNKSNNNENSVKDGINKFSNGAIDHLTKIIQNDNQFKKRNIIKYKEDDSDSS